MQLSISVQSPYLGLNRGGCDLPASHRIWWAPVFFGVASMTCINIQPLIEESTGEGSTVDYTGECSTECTPLWRDSGPAVCVNGESKIPQVDGCGNSRLVAGGNACCIQNWAPTGKEKCENAISFREEFDGCGEYRWVQGGSACCIPEWVMTPTTRCFNGVSQQLWVDGCSNAEWRSGGNACPPVSQGLENTHMYAVVEYAPPYDGYWGYPDNCAFIEKHKVRIADWQQSTHGQALKRAALLETSITLTESWVDGRPYLGAEWPSAAGPIYMLRFAIGGNGPVVGRLHAEEVGGLTELFIQFYSWRRADNTIEWCNGATTNLAFPPDGSPGTFLGMHSWVYPPQANGADYRASPFMSNIWLDAFGYHFVSVDTLYRNSSTSPYVGQCVGMQAAGAPQIAIWSCGISSSRSVLEFDATCAEGA